ncbi:hypothetical protein [Actinoplanes sp. URMC 104]|uniref:hypothetical protein n=1 Tax=Actinoplanes sp. URMC 104 TaxID=3423409 RepID=UPI003F1B62EB
MRLKLPWGPQARYRRALAAARQWQEEERRNAFARLRLQAAEDLSERAGIRAARPMEPEARAWTAR